MAPGGPNQPSTPGGGGPTLKRSLVRLEAPVEVPLAGWEGGEWIQARNKWLRDL